jgi:hypothetical protein
MFCVKNLQGFIENLYFYECRVLTAIPVSHYDIFDVSRSAEVHIPPQRTIRIVIGVATTVKIVQTRHSRSVRTEVGIIIPIVVILASWSVHSKITCFRNKIITNEEYIAKTGNLFLPF